MFYLLCLLLDVIVQRTDELLPRAGGAGLGYFIEIFTVTD